MASYKAEFMKLSKVELAEKLAFATEVMCDNCPYLWVENGSSHNKQSTPCCECCGLPLVLECKNPKCDLSPCI